MSRKADPRTKIFVSPRLQVVEADEYERDRGNDYQFHTTHNGYQYIISHAVSKLELQELRDGINDLLGESDE